MSKTSNFITALLFGLSAVVISATSVHAAVITPTSRDLCKIQLEGAIEQGDADTFATVAAAVFPSEVGESTANNTVCLNSPGGSFIEGIRLASLFYDEGVGTVIDAGASCYSACALMFMMGRADGAEVSFVNRKLSSKGELGFHRPSLHLGGDGSYVAGDLELSYDMAVGSVADYIALANKTSPWSATPMVKADLIERIFMTRGDELFLIDTVEKAARWEIELLGVQYPPTIDEAAAYYACENTLQWRVGRHEKAPNFTGLTLTSAQAWDRPFSVRRPSHEDAQLFDVIGAKSGYASAGCLVSYAEGRLSICGVDEYTDTIIGTPPCETGSDTNSLRSVDALAIWHPLSSLEELAYPISSESFLGTCRVSKDGAVLDDENCTASVQIEYASDGQASTLMIFGWPSGNNTIVRQFGRLLTVNGKPADRDYLEGFDACYLNHSTGNLFCYVKG